MKMAQDVLIHFLNSNDTSTEMHYNEKEYRDDVIVEIDGLFYEVYFFVEGSLKYEMRKDGFFTFPGVIILDEITNEKIYNAIGKLIEYDFFNYFVGKKDMPLNQRFMNRWYLNSFPIKKIENIISYRLR